jgi:4,5-DOPA dioxygenase extradiol
MKLSPKTSSLFISHGAPDLLIRDIPAKKFLQELAQSFEKPDAIIVFSAHFESDQIEITSARRLMTIHDFGGFPAELSRMHYTVEGAPALAFDVMQIFEDAGISASLNSKRGIDHGAWVPLKLIYPDADIPVIQISIQPYEEALYHYKIGRILAELKQKNILIIGSGSVTHNLYTAMSMKDAETPFWAEIFCESLAKKLDNSDVKALLDWFDLPHAQDNHPSPEHFVPLLIALGAAGDNPTATRLHHSFDYSVLAMDCYVFSGS